MPVLAQVDRAQRHENERDREGGQQGERDRAADRHQPELGVAAVYDTVVIIVDIHVEGGVGKAFFTGGGFVGVVVTLLDFSFCTDICGWLFTFSIARASNNIPSCNPFPVIASQPTTEIDRPLL